MRPVDVTRGIVAAALVVAASACAEDPVAERASTTAASAGTTTAAETPVAPGRTTTGPVDDPAAAEPPAGFPATGERFLLARLPRDVARRCTRTPEGERSRGAIAGLTCDTQAAHGARSSFELFRTRVAMEGAYGRHRAANGVPAAQGRCAPPAGGGRVPGDAPWGFGPEAPSAGRVMCFRTGDEVRFVTSVDAINVLAFAAAERFGAVDRFWRTVGIPRAQPPRGGR